MNIESIDCVQKKFLEPLNVQEVAVSGLARESLVDREIANGVNYLLEVLVDPGANGRVDSLLPW